jgi:nucleoside-triphosphatase THEP1
MKNTIVINLFGGPGVGKSTLCASVFAKLKIMSIECEMATEYAKDITWEESYKKLENQIYVFGIQHSWVHRLLGKVDVVITDSPLLNSIVYDKNNNLELRNLVLSEFRKLNTLNFYVSRKLKYEQNGRNQTIHQAIEVDNIYKKLLNDNDIQYIEIEPGQTDIIISKVIEMLNEK